MNIYNYNHVLNGKNELLFASSRYDGATGLAACIHLEDADGNIDTRSLPVRPIVSYDIEELKPNIDKYTQSIKDQGSWAFYVNDANSSIYSSTMDVNFVTMTNKKQSNFEDVRRRLVKLEQARNAVVKAQSNGAEFINTVAGFVASFGYTRSHGSTLSKLYTMTNDNLFFDIIVNMTNPKSVFDIANNMIGELNMKFAIDNHNKHIAEFEAIFRELAEDAKTAKVKQDVFNVALKMLKEEIVNHADYSNFPTTADGAVYSYVFINSLLSNQENISKESLVFRVLFSVDKNIAIKAALEAKLEIADKTILTDVMLNNNSQTLYDMLERSTTSMFEVLDNVEVVDILFSPLKQEFPILHRMMLRSFGSALIYEWKNFDMASEERMQGFVPLLTRTMAFSIGCYNMLTVKGVPYSMATFKEMGKVMYGIQDGMRARVLRQNAWRYLVSDKNDAAFKQALTIDVVAKFVKLTIEPMVSVLKTELWLDPTDSANFTIVANNNEILRRWCRFSFDFSFIEQQLYLVSELTSHELHRSTTSDYRREKYLEYAQLLSNVLRAKKTKLLDPRLDERKNFPFDYDSQKFIETALVEWLGFDRQWHYNRYITLFENNDFMVNNKPSVTMPMPYAEIVEPFVYFATKPSADIMMIAEPDFYVFYLFYRILAKAQADVVLRKLMVKMITSFYFQIFTDFQALLYKNTSKNTDDVKVDIIQHSLDSCFLFNNIEKHVVISPPAETGNYVHERSNNPLLILPRLTYDDKKTIVKNALGLLLKNTLKPVEEYDNSMAALVEKTWKVDLSLDMATLLNLLSGNATNSENRFLHPKYIQTEKARKVYADYLSYYFLTRAIDEAELVLEKSANGIKNLDEFSITKKVPDKLTLQALVELDQNFTMFDKTQQNNEVFDCYWMWSPSRDELGRSFVVYHMSERIFHPSTRLSLQCLRLELADGMEGTYTFVCGSSMRGYMSKSVSIRLQQKCLRTGRWFEEVTDNAEWGNVTWSIKSPYVMKGWYSAYTHLPYASHMPSYVSMNNFLNSIDEKTWLQFMGDVETTVSYLPSLIFKQRKLWIQNRLFAFIGDGYELLKFLFLFLANNQTPHINTFTGSPDTRGLMFANSLAFVSYFDASMNRRGISIRNYKYYYDFIDFCQLYIKGGKQAMTLLQIKQFDYFTANYTSSIAAGYSMRSGAVGCSMRLLSPASQKVINEAMNKLKTDTFVALPKQTGTVEEKEAEESPPVVMTTKESHIPEISDSDNDPDFSDIFVKEEPLDPDEEFFKEPTYIVEIPVKQEQREQSEGESQSSSSVFGYVTNLFNLNDKLGKPMTINDAVATLQMRMVNVENTKDMSLASDEKKQLVEKLEIDLQNVKSMITTTDKDHDDIVEKAQEMLDKLKI